MGIEHSQNYLHSKQLVATLLSKSNICNDDIIIEIGPGKGIITIELAKKSKQVIAILFIAIGIIIGSISSEKASSGISSIVVQLVCFTSGMYFPRETLGNVFGKICEYLPFESCLTILKGIMNNNLESITARNIAIFIIYTITILVVSVIIFKKKMISDNK